MEIKKRIPSAPDFKRIKIPRNKFNEVGEKLAVTGLRWGGGETIKHG